MILKEKEEAILSDCNDDDTQNRNLRRHDWAVFGRSSYLCQRGVPFAYGLVEGLYLRLKGLAPLGPTFEVDEEGVGVYLYGVNQLTD